MYLSFKRIFRVADVIFITVFFIFCENPCAQISIQQLPLDEKEAYIMLKEGTLDSSTWELFGHYYEQPLNVPDGELKELVDVFPEIGHDVPLSKEQFAAYEPWTEKDVRRFFSDFPELSNLRPILSFETSKKSHVGQAGVAINKYTETDPALYARFSIIPNSTISVQGRIACLNSFARWQRRSVFAQLPAAGTLTVGNFDLNFDNGLFYGYFPQSPADTDVLQNWQYAGSNTWNGAMFDADIGGRVHGCVFIHQRMSETVYGIKCIDGITDHINVIAAESRLKAKAAGGARADSVYYGDAGVTFIQGHWNTGVFAGVASHNTSAIPILLYVKNSSGIGEFDASYARIPAGVPAPRSALKYRFSKKTHQPDSIASDEQTINCSCRLPVFYGARSSCGVSYYYSLGAAAAEGYAGISGKTWIDYALRYTYKPSLGTAAEYHLVTASFSRQLWQGLRCSFFGRCTAESGQYQSVFMRTTFGIVPSSSMDLAPFVTIFASNDNNQKVSCGVTQVLRLFEKTWSEVKIEVPLTKKNQDQWVLDAKANFYL
jgi:hypothetical protein